MRGVGFEVEEMMKLFLVIIIGLGVVILIIAASGGISSMLAEFCAKNPNICGGTVDTRQMKIVENSMDGLVCAINSVEEGKPWSGCKSEVKGSGFEGSIKLSSEFTGFAAADINKGTTVDCKNQGTDGYVCNVNNFQLPQTITNAQEWIVGMGDPNFLLYYQAFPKEESDAWQISKTNVVALSIIGSGVLNAAFAGFGSIASKGFSVVYTAGKDVGEKVMAKIFGKLGKEGAKATEEKVVIGLSGELKEGIKKMTSQSLFKFFDELPEKELNKAVDLIIKDVNAKWEGKIPEATKVEITDKVIRFVENNGDYIPPKLVAQFDKAAIDKLTVENRNALEKIYYMFKDKLGGVEKKIPGKADYAKYGLVISVAYIAEYVDSINEKFKSVGEHSLALRSPFKDTIKYDLQTVNSKPIYIELSRENSFNDPRFYLASPCRATLTIKKGKTSCWQVDKDGKLLVDSNNNYVPGTSTIDVEGNKAAICGKRSWWYQIWSGTSSLVGKGFSAAYSLVKTPDSAEMILVDGNGQVYTVSGDEIKETQFKMQPESSTDQYDVYSCTDICTTVDDNVAENKAVGDIFTAIPWGTFTGISDEQNSNLTEIKKYTLSGSDSEKEWERLDNDMKISLAAGQTDSTDAIIISVKGDSGGSSDYTHNYCYWGANLGKGAVSTGVLIASIGIDVFAVPTGPAAPVIMFATGAGTAYVSHTMEQWSMWPSGGVGG